MSGYIGNVPTPQATQSRDSFTATAGQTSFATSGYSAGGQFLDVHLNGVKLQNTEDYTATNGSDVALTVGAGAGDTLEVVSFSTFEVADVYTRAETYSKVEADAEIAFKSFTEGANTGYGTAHRVNNPAYYGDIGSDALDLSYNAFASTTRGATGANSTAIGGGVTASGANSTAIGSNSEASGLRSTAIAYRALASGDNSVAAGYIATASGIGSFAQASRGNASGSYSANFGNRTYASGYTAFASGNGTTAAGDNSFVVGYNGGTGTASGTVFGVAYGNSTGDITASTTDTNLVLAVSNAGHVTMPYQPAFHAIYANGYGQTLSGTTRHALHGRALVNAGNAYNASTGYFTAPVSGTYQLSIGMGANQVIHSAGYIVAELEINGSTNSSGLYSSSSDVTNQMEGGLTSGPWLVYLNAGDYVRPYYYCNMSYATGGSTVTGWQQARNYFSGYLIG